MPSLHLPDPVRISDPGSFARQTFVERLPKIIDSMLAQNSYPDPIRQDLLALKAELARSAPLGPLPGDQADSAAWNTRLAAFPLQGWLELPFYFGEAFFYRRLLQAVRYFEPGAWQGVDPFQPVKDAQLQKDLRHFESALERLAVLPAESRAENLLTYCLWGNSVDLSLFRGDFQDPAHRAAGQERLILQQSPAIARRLSSGVRSLAYVLDNVGIELYFDLGLVDFLLERGWVEQVTFHLKGAPFFISDAMPKDLQASLRLLQDSGSPAARSIGLRLEEALRCRRIRLDADPLWTSGLTYLEAPAELERALSAADLAIFKGDLNYRRLLGDYHWEPTTRVEDILQDLRLPVVILRTPKSQIVAGLTAEQVRQLNAADPQWLIDGKYGIIQLVER